MAMKPRAMKRKGNANAGMKKIKQERKSKMMRGGMAAKKKAGMMRGGAAKKKR